jgi:hypothetical protein
VKLFPFYITFAWQRSVLSPQCVGDSLSQQIVEARDNEAKQHIHQNPLGPIELAVKRVEPRASGPVRVHVTVIRQLIRWGFGDLILTIQKSMTSFVSKAAYEGN